MSDSPPLEVRRVIEAPRERVFAAWTRPEQLRRWWGVTAQHTTPLAEVDLRVGGAYRLTMRAADGTDHTVAGTYEEVAAPERLVYSWQWESGNSPPTRVTAEFLEKAPGFTEIVLTHVLIQRRAYVDCYSSVYAPGRNHLSQLSPNQLVTKAVVGHI